MMGMQSDRRRTIWLLGGVGIVAICCGGSCSSTGSGATGTTGAGAASGSGAASGGPSGGLVDQVCQRLADCITTIGYGGYYVYAGNLYVYGYTPTATGAYSISSTDIAACAQEGNTCVQRSTVSSSQNWQAAIQSCLAMADCPSFGSCVDRAPRLDCGAVTAGTGGTGGASAGVGGAAGTGGVGSAGTSTAGTGGVGTAGTAGTGSAGTGGITCVTCDVTYDCGASTLTLSSASGSCVGSFDAGSHVELSCDGTLVQGGTNVGTWLGSSGTVQSICRSGASCSTCTRR